MTGAEPGERKLRYLRVKREHGCFQDLTWGCELHEPVRACDLVPGLVAIGYRDETRAAGVCNLRHPAGHEVVIVPRTGRVQIRIHVLTSRNKRADAAFALASQIDDLIARLDPQGRFSGAVWCAISE